MHLVYDKENPQKEKWREIREIYATHIFGKPPERIFINRRPLESRNPYALKYRLLNFEPITKQPFLIAINSIIEVAEHVYAPINNVGEQTANWITNTNISVGGRNYSPKKFITSYLSWIAESDPNACLVVLPKHPTEKLIASYKSELPDFNEIQNQFIDVDVKIIPSDLIEEITANYVKFYGGEWQVDEDVYMPYYYILDSTFTLLSIPVKTKDGIVYDEIIYYANNLENKPFVILGNNISFYKDGEGNEFFYREGTYPGAVSIMNEVIGVKSDSNIVDTRFTYPEKIAQYSACSAPGCMPCLDEHNPLFGVNVIYKSDGSCGVCDICKGTGKVQPDTSPLGTHIMVKDEMFDEAGKFIPPIQFITPPLQSAEYLDKKWRLDFAEGKKALFILEQNMTNQSGISKSYDVKQKVTVLTNAVKNLYNICSVMMNAVSGYFLEGENIYFDMPTDFNVKTSEDIVQELSVSANISNTFTSELTKELLLKKFGSDDEMTKAISFLQLYDKLFGYSIPETVQAKAMYGNNITARDQFIHDKGLAIIQEIMEEEENFVNLTNSQIRSIFDQKVDELFTEVPAEPIV